MTSVNSSDFTDYRGPGAPEHHAWNVPAILRLLPKGKLRIVDAGCGNGRLAGLLADLGHSVIGTELSRSGLAKAQEAYPQANYLYADVYDDITELLFDRAADVVIGCELIEHLYDPLRFLRNAHAMLRPGGSLILTTPYHGYVKNLAISLVGGWDKHFMVESRGGHIKFFSPATLRALLFEAGFGTVMVRGAGRVPLLRCCMAVRADTSCTGTTTSRCTFVR